MSLSVARTLAVTVADVKARLRRPASAWLLGALALAAYLTIPAPSAERGLFVIDGARARHTSAAVAVATATLLPLFLGLFGFYVVSRAIGHDVRTRVGPLVAATPVRRAEYLLGKLIGSTTILVAVSGGFLLCVMGMHLVRGEGPLRPLVYLADHAVIALPCALAVAATALFFECAPGLGGRAGDVLYFFAWFALLPLALEVWRGEPTPDPGVGRYFDFSGLGFALANLIRLTGSSNVSIGSSPYDPGRPAVDLPDLALTPEAFAWRAQGLLMPALLLLAAVALFRRFDPARTGPTAALARRSPLALVSALARPPSRWLIAAITRSKVLTGRSVAGRCLGAEILVTALLNPLFPLVAAVAVALTVALPAGALRAGALPALTALLVPLLADLPVRDVEAGITGIVRTVPGLGRRHALFKLGTAASVGLLVTAAPAVRLLAQQPRSGVSLVLGTLLLAAASVLLGVATGSPKPFMAFGLGFWYVALSAGGRVPALDFAGFSAAATPAVQAGYAATIVVVAAAALALARWRESWGD